MARLLAFYSRANENYFGDAMKYIEVGNIEKVANMIADTTGADIYKIEQKISYSADYKTSVVESKKDLQCNSSPELAKMRKVLISMMKYIWVIFKQLAAEEGNHAAIFYKLTGKN